MKKLLALILAAALALSLVACGGGKADYAELVLGDWTGDYDAMNNATIGVRDGKEIHPGDSMTETLSVFKGGTAEILLHDNDTGAEQTYSATWEVSDDVLIISRTFNGHDIIDSFGINTDTEPYTLSMQGSGVPQTLTKVIEQ